MRKSILSVIVLFIFYLFGIFIVIFEASSNDKVHGITLISMLILGWTISWLIGEKNESD